MEAEMGSIYLPESKIVVFWTEDQNVNLEVILVLFKEARQYFPNLTTSQVKVGKCSGCFDYGHKTIHFGGPCISFSAEQESVPAKIELWVKHDFTYNFTITDL